MPGIYPSHWRWRSRNASVDKHFNLHTTSNDDAESQRSALPALLSGRLKSSTSLTPNANVAGRHQRRIIVVAGQTVEKLATLHDAGQEIAVSRKWI